MERPTSYWLGVSAFALLGAISLYSCVPHIEADIGDRTSQALRSEVWLTVQVDGQEVHLTGTAPNGEARAAVVERAASIWGVTRVHNHIELPDGGLADIATSSPSPPAGQAPQLETESEPEIDSEPEGQSVPAQIDTTVATVDAVAVPAITPSLELAASAVEAAEQCQERLNDLLEGQRVNFNFGSVRLAADSHGLLRAIAEAAAGCNDVEIEVAGYTDSWGKASANQTVSQRRAQAVVSFLVDAGVPEAQLQAVGYGEDDPVADNATLEGRQANRRIEFKARIPKGDAAARPADEQQGERT